MEEIKDKIKKLKDQGHTVYSISRLNTVDECGYEYLLTYIKHFFGTDNIYSFTGSKIHECLENIQNGKEVDLPTEINKMVEDAKFLDISFPNEKIEEKWMKNIMKFAQDYKAPHYPKVETEKLFLVEIDGHYLQGIIDLLVYNEDGTVSIIDYKTSSKYPNKELESKGRQLILYGLAMEQLGYKVKDVAWQFLKYVEVSYKLKNGKTRTTVAERGYVLEKLKNDIMKEMLALNQWEPLEAEEMVDKAVEDNSFDGLPQSIRDKYTIKDYLCYYDFTDERKEETRKFINAKIGDIENFSDDESWWEPKEITKFTAFYCQHLCGHRNRCEHYQAFQADQDYFDEERISREAEEELKKFI